MLRGEIKILKEEKAQLQHQVQQEIVIQDGLKVEVGQLTKQAQVKYDTFHSGFLLDKASREYGCFIYRLYSLISLSSVPF